MPALSAPANPSGNLTDPDLRLVSEAQKDSSAFQALYDRWAVPVYQYFYYRTGDEAGAEDLTSQLFLSAYQSLPRYVHRGHFAAWLFAIARNLVRKDYRQKQRQLPLEMAQQAASPSDPSLEYAQTDELECLKRLVLTLSKEEQELIRLRYAAGLSFADMAIVLQKHEDAVKKSLYRLQARLQVLLEQNHE
ncbi:MAG: sigma-70 family RNA polymerase sigma factor [Anaerolineaceae bacterium]|nr:sigma-70 family RNA polymerase sigma factor [Anaerolineaceae bacterium]